MSQYPLLSPLEFMTMAQSSPFPLTVVTMSFGSLLSSFMRIRPIFAEFSHSFSSWTICKFTNFTLNTLVVMGQDGI